MSTRPFAFEDLPLNHNGKRIEPEKWGPIYSKPPKPGRKVDVDRWPSNCASGQKYDFSAKLHRAKLKAEFTAVCNADRRAWAADNSKAKHAAYAAAPKWRPKVTAAKPHYVLRDGAWKLAA